MERNDSCPAVSQICSLICLLSIVIMRAPNSTPMVRSCTGWKRLSVNCRSKHDFPTPVSPMMMYLPGCRVGSGMRPVRPRCALFSSAASDNDTAKRAHGRQATRPGYGRKPSHHQSGAPGKAGFELLFVGRAHLKRYEYDMAMWVGLLLRKTPEPG